MGHARKLHLILLGGLLTVAGCYGTGRFDGPEVLLPPMDPAVLAPPAAPAPLNPAVASELPTVPSIQAADRPLPINLLSAMQLANVRSVDIAAAAQGIRVAVALLEQARVLWLPTIALGADYYRHDGPIQDVSNAIFNDSHTSLLLGAGPDAVVSVDDAIFAPLYARQQVRSRQADLQAASNNTLVAVTDAYFTVQQARGHLAGVTEAIRLNEDLIARTRKLAPAIVPDLEVFRAEAELAHLRERELFYREQWKVASAQLLQVLRLDPAAQVEPVEPPQLSITLIDLKKPVDELIPIGLTYRPELASQQAQVQATLVLLRQERLRPLIPSVLLRGVSTSPGGTLAGGAFFPTPFGSAAGMRGDVDVQVLWQLNNLGFGNRALVHQREAENRLALVQLFRIQDLVASEVAQAYAQAQLAARRVEVTETGLRTAILSANKNLEALSQTKGVGARLVTIVRPQEVLAAIQALLQAFINYYTAVADANRAQFRLYRALGQPAQYLAQDDKATKPCAPSVPSAEETSPTLRTPSGESSGAGDSTTPK